MCYTNHRLSLERLLTLEKAARAGHLCLNVLDILTVFGTARRVARVPLGGTEHDSVFISRGLHVREEREMHAASIKRPSPRTWRKRRTSFVRSLWRTRGGWALANSAELAALLFPRADFLIAARRTSKGGTPTNRC